MTQINLSLGQQAFVNDLNCAGVSFNQWQNGGVNGSSSSALPEKHDITCCLTYCSNGQNFTCYDILDVSVTPPVIFKSIWKNEAGIEVPAPPNPILGACGSEWRFAGNVSRLGYMQSSSGTLDNYLGFSVAAGNMNDITLIPSFLWDSRYEIFVVIDGISIVGNGAGANYGGQYPVTLNSIQDIANYLNNLPQNMGDVWGVGSNGELLLIYTNTTPSLHSWSSLVVCHYDASGNSDYVIIKNDPTAIKAIVNSGGGCITIERKQWEHVVTGAIKFRYFNLDESEITGIDVSKIVDSCPIELKHSIYNLGIRGSATIADLEAMAGGKKINSVIIQLISGTMTLEGDAGSDLRTVIVNAGQAPFIKNWSALSEVNILSSIPKMSVSAGATAWIHFNYRA